MTWAARYSRTEQPELTIYRDGEVCAYANTKRAESAIRLDPCGCGDTHWRSWILAASHNPDLRADIAARVPVRECEETQACTNWAMPDGRCHHLHGGSDEL